MSRSLTDDFEFPFVQHYVFLGRPLKNCFYSTVTEQLPSWWMKEMSQVSPAEIAAVE